MSALTLTLVASLALAQQPTEVVGVAITSERAGAVELGESLALQVHQALVREGLPNVMDPHAVATKVKDTGALDPKTCKGARSCAQKAAVLLGARAVVVSVDVGKLGPTVVVHLEALAADSEKPLEVADVTADAEQVLQKSAVPVTVFARSLAQKLAARATPPVAARVEPKPEPVAKADAPAKASLVPPPPEVDPSVTNIDDAPRSRAAPIAVTSITVAAAATAVAFLAVGLSAKSEYEGARVGNGTSLTRDQADALAGRANTGFTVALGAGSAAVAGGVVSAILWSR